MSERHTPTPWCVDFYEGGYRRKPKAVIRTIHIGGFKVATCDTDSATGCENAEFIVRACNEWAALRKALRWAASELSARGGVDDDDFPPPEYHELLALIRDAPPISAGLTTPKPLSEIASDAATPAAAARTPPPYHTESAGHDETWIWSDDPKRLIARCYRADDAEAIVLACNEFAQLTR